MLPKSIKRNKNNATDTTKRKQSHWSDGLYPASELMPLEQRIMLDGAAPAVLFDVVDVDSVNDERVAVAESIAAATTVADTEPQRHEVVIVDASIDGYEQLLTDVLGDIDKLYWQTDESGIESIVAQQDDRLVSVYAIKDGQDGLQSISNILDGHKDVDAVHVLSHGNDTGILFNGNQINSVTLKAEAASVSAWSHSLTADGDILLYGCETGVAGSSIGFVQTLSTLTGADVAASDDLTGSAMHGGDWELEVASGPVEAELITQVEAQAAFAGVLAADPAVTLDVPGGSFLNEGFEFCAIVENTGTSVGYEPYVNVFTDPGINVNGASFLGASLPISEFTWDAASGNWLDSSGNPLTAHPLNADIPLPGAPAVDGTAWLLVDMPFGSFVPGQPPAKIVFDAALDPAQGAALGQPLGISAQTGFELGEDALSNPSSDPPLLGPLETSTVTPTVMEVDKESWNDGDNAVGIEAEAATGANNPITFEIRVDVADGQTIDNILLSDVVPNNVHYLGSLTVAGSGALVNIGTSDATIGVLNGNQLSVSFDSVTGTSANDDIFITYQGYIAELDADGNPVLDPVSGAADDPVENTVQVDGVFNTIPVTDSYTDEILPGSIQIQKSVEILDSTGAPVTRDTITPGDLLEWTLKYQVSDYMSLDAFEITDAFGDGQLYVTGSETVEIFENGNNIGPLPITAANVSLGSISPATGFTQVTYDMASVIAAEVAGSSGELHGDLVDGTLSGKTWVHVTFRTEVQEAFQFPSVFGGDPSVDVGDILTNTTSVTAEVLGTGNEVSDSSAAEVEVDTPVASKSIYAINLDTNDWDTANPEIAPGQSITYRITIELPTTDVENLSIVDYLPLPILKLHQVTHIPGYTLV